MGFIRKNKLKKPIKEYDFGLNWSGNVEEYFVARLKGACRKRALSFFWICRDNVRDVFRKLEGGQIILKFLLDTEAGYNMQRDPYARVCYAVKDSGGVVFNDPDRARIAEDKSVMHYELIRMGIETPYSIVVRNWEPRYFRLKDDEKKRLGAPFIIKPAAGYGQLGVVRDARGSIREIAKARNFDRGDNFLLQEKITPIELGGRRAWFRVFNVFNKIIPCWWDDQQHFYEHVTYQEFKLYGLLPLAEIVSNIAYNTRMVWFSTEIAVDRKYGENRFVVIDYVNDQCDMTAKSESRNGVPDYIVDDTADRIVDAASQALKKEEFDRKYNIWLKDFNLSAIKGLGEFPNA